MEQPIKPTHSDDIENSGHDEGRLKSLMENRSYGEEQFDKLIIYLNSGALVLSMGFIENIISYEEAIWKPVLIISWLLFSSSLLVNLYSHKMSVKSIDLELLGEEQKSDHLNKAVNSMNKFTIFLFGGGILTLLYFTSINFIS